MHLCGAELGDPEPLEAATGRSADGAFDLCIANILRGPLVELQPRLSGYVRPGACLSTPCLRLGGRGEEMEEGQQGQARMVLGRPSCMQNDGQGMAAEEKGALER